MPLALTKALAKMLKAVDCDIPISAQISAILALISESILKVILVSILAPPCNTIILHC